MTTPLRSATMAHPRRTTSAQGTPLNGNGWCFSRVPAGAGTSSPARSLGMLGWAPLSSSRGRRLRSRHGAGAWRASSTSPGRAHSRACMSRLSAPAATMPSWGMSGLSPAQDRAGSSAGGRLSRRPSGTSASARASGAKLAIGSCLAVAARGRAAPPCSLTMWHWPSQALPRLWGFWTRACGCLSTHTSKASHHWMIRPARPSPCSNPPVCCSAKSARGRTPRSAGNACSRLTGFPLSACPSSSPIPNTTCLRYP
mmetsp:Transcript_12761/g.36215  ORF Transcript_12761/g.36215 Transcript_12761/m.36215 type:complete len:255 (-) Transcript_12761:1684-2448(-)